MMQLSYKKWLGLWMAVHTLLFVVFHKTHTICHFSFLRVLWCPAGIDLFSLSGVFAWLELLHFVFVLRLYFAVKSRLVLWHWQLVIIPLKPEMWQTVMSCWKKFCVIQKVKTSHQKVKQNISEIGRMWGPAIRGIPTKCLNCELLYNI